MAPMAPVAATAGSTVRLPCTMPGGHQAAVTWEKVVVTPSTAGQDGVGMGAGAGHRMAADGSLLLYNVGPGSTGRWRPPARPRARYSCTSSLGRHRRTVSVMVTVLPAASAPVLGLRQERVTVERQEEGAGQRRQGGAEERRHDTDLSYDVGGRGRAGDRFVVVSLEEARTTVDRALNRTVEVLFEAHRHTARTPSQLLNIFRYPSAGERELARAGEIYQRTLELVEAKVRESVIFRRCASGEGGRPV